MGKVVVCVDLDQSSIGDILFMSEKTLNKDDSEIAVEMIKVVEVRWVSSSVLRVVGISNCFSFS